MLKKIIKHFRDTKEKKLSEQRRFDYIQKRVMETEIGAYKNRKEEKKTSGKQYFFDSKIYGKIFK